jgi:hypothetical protein
MGHPHRLSFALVAIFVIALSCSRSSVSLSTLDRRDKTSAGESSHSTYGRGLHLTALQSDTTLSRVKVSNPSGSCITISHATSLSLVDSTIGPCAGHGIAIDSSARISITDTSIRETNGNGVSVNKSREVNIVNNFFAHNATSVYAHQSQGVAVRSNFMSNVQGPKPRGQYIQYDKVFGAGNAIYCNTGISSLGGSKTEDGISIYKSSGLPSDALAIRYNRIIGGGPSKSGGGIMLGDGGYSRDIIAASNLLVNPGQYGIAIAGGSRISIIDNIVYGAKRAYTNVGIYIWNQNPEALCDDNVVHGNRVMFYNSKGVPNPFWDSGNCGRSAHLLERNRWDSSLSEASMHHIDFPCKKFTTSRDG